MATAQQIYSMLGNENLWQTAAVCHELLAASKVPHAICGGVAVCLHGYQRNTVDIDLIIRKSTADRVKDVGQHAGWEWHPQRAEFRTPSGIAVQFLYSGERAGHGAEVHVPDPEGESNVETVEGLPTLSLSRLVEMKLACGLGNVRRTHKDFADVVELIAVRHLDASFARYLHKSVRKTYRELVRRARGQA